MADYKKEWFRKAEIDYFAPFISLWLACNSWYQSHYSELTAKNNPNKSATDRDHINKIKQDISARNHLYVAFRKLLENDDRNFKTNLESLHRSLMRVSIRPENVIYDSSFSTLLIDFENKKQETAYLNIIKNPSFNKNGEISLADQGSVIKLDQIYISSNIAEVFAGIFELIYQIRNQLVHGRLNPEKDEHEVVKYCYLILLDQMKSLCI